MDPLFKYDENTRCIGVWYKTWNSDVPLKQLCSVSIWGRFNISSQNIFPEICLTQNHIRNLLFGFFHNFCLNCSTSNLNLFSIWLSHGSEFKSLVILLKFCLCLCHFIIVRTLHLNFSKFWQIIWNCISVIWVDKKTILCYVSCISDCKYVIIHKILAWAGGDSTPSPSLDNCHHPLQGNVTYTAEQQ